MIITNIRQNRPYPGNNTTPENFAEVDGDPPMPPPVRDGPDAPIPGFPASLQPNFPSSGTNVTKRAVVIKRSNTNGQMERGAGRWKSAYKQWGQDGYGEAGKGYQNGKSTGSGCGPEECKGLPGRELILPPVSAPSHEF